MNELEYVEMEQKYLTQIFTKNQEIISLRTNATKVAEDSSRLAESLKMQLEAQRKELIEANSNIIKLNAALEEVKRVEQKAINKLIELGVGFSAD